MKNAICIILFLLVSIRVISQNEKRIALVIGNADYKYGNSLKNPVNDAELMSRILLKLGFHVTKKTNLTKAQMQEAIISFCRQVKSYDVALFYYAGHGIQVDGINYIIPVDSKIDDPLSVQFEAMKLDNIVSQFEYYPDHSNIVILDACRENPFLSWVRGTMNSFAPINAPKGSLIAFSTGSGSAASDDMTSGNGLYTGILAKQMLLPQRIEDVFINTRNEVHKASNGKQQAQEWSQLSKVFYFTNTNVDNTADTTTITNITDTVAENHTKAFSGKNGEFEDIINKLKYKWIKIGSQIWLAENCRKYIDETNSICYNYDKNNLNQMGMLYTWEGAQNACPLGWHLPSKDEYNELFSYLGDNDELGSKLKSALKKNESVIYWDNQHKIEVNNSSGFNVLPIGVLINQGIFKIHNSSAHFWTSNSYGNSDAVAIQLVSNNNRVGCDVLPVSAALSVRCLKNK